MPTVGSLFSGIGGFDLGLERAGFEVAWQCDNDPFCNKVLAKHWPEVRRYGDVRDICIPAELSSRSPIHSGNGRRSGSVGIRTWDAATELSVDLICGGFPCQDLSVAGKRAGLDGARSGLWFEFHRILSELRPSYCLIENVPGLLSSNKGQDFAIVLEGLGQLWPAVGWAILDSQYFGVPQRRRRVYIVGGPSREHVAQVLSLCEGGDWHTPTRREAREDVAVTIRGRSASAGVNAPGRGGEDDLNLVLANPLGAAEGSFGGWRGDLDHDTYIPVAHALRAKDGTHRTTDASDDNLIVTHSLRADGLGASDDGTGRGTPLTIIQDARGVRDKAQNGIGIQQIETMYTLDSVSEHAFQQGATVRRLTPVECERLQGFPDGWTQVDDKTADGPRYKALGNAVTVPVIEYLGRRILEVMNGNP